MYFIALKPVEPVKVGTQSGILSELFIIPLFSTTFIGLASPVLPLKQLETFAKIFQELLHPQTKTVVRSKKLRRLYLLPAFYDPEQTLKTLSYLMLLNRMWGTTENKGYKFLSFILSTAGKHGNSSSSKSFLNRDSVVHFLPQFWKSLSAPWFS